MDLPETLGKWVSAASDEEDRATKKVRNREVESQEGVGGSPFKEALLNQSREEGKEREEVGEEDVYVSFENSMLEVNFSERVQGLMVQAMKQTVIVRLLV